MPYRRSYRPRRRSMRRRRRSGRRGRRAPMTAGRVKRLIGAELKYDLTAADFAITPTTGNLIRFTQDIAQGDTVTTRTGNWINPQVIHGKVVVKGDPTALPGTDSFLCRIGVLQWLNDVQFDPPANNQIVQDPFAPLGPLNITGRGSFKQVWSRTFVIANDMANPQFFKTFPFYLRVGKYPKCVYDGANPKKYHWYFYAISDSIVVQSPGLSIDAIMRFTDS